MKEIWKDIEGYEGHYQVSDLGNVRSLKFGKTKQMKLSPSRLNYQYVTLTLHNKQRKIQVHRLVASAFLSNPDSLPVVNHLDGNPSNNSVANLEWTTYKGNTRHAIESGTFNAVGENNPNAKLTESDVECITVRLQAGELHKVIAKDFGVSRQTITEINRKTIWQ